MDFKFYRIEPGENPTLVPLFLSTVKAGFPNPAENYIEKTIDLNEQLVSNPPATFYVKVSGESMIDANLQDGDILIVDKSINAKNGNIVIAVIDGEFTVKRLGINKDGSIDLIPENKKFKPVKITSDTDFRIWGVVTYIIHAAL